MDSTFEGFDIDEFEEQVVMESPVQSPLRIDRKVLEVGEFSIAGYHLKDFHDNALHLDKKSDTSFVTIVVQNNFCFVYSINIGIELYAVYGCEYECGEPLMFTLPLNRILKLLNDEMITFKVQEDIIEIVKRSMEIEINKVDIMFEKECSEYVNTLYDLYEVAPTDTFESADLTEVLTTLSTYAKMNNADERLILFDKGTAYVRGIGYYVYKAFKTNATYIVNPVFSNLLLRLSKGDFPVHIVDNDDIYTVIANNYVMNFPVLDGEFKFNLLGKIQPTKAFKVEKREFVTALNQIDLYSEKDCGMSMRERLYLQNKTVQGTARVDIHLEVLEGEAESATYMFNHDKLLRILSGIKGGEVVIMECNTREHLYISDEKMSHFVILSVK